MKVKSIILARGGSKTIPKKNIIDLGGSPLLWYSASASLGAEVDETWVSTDCPEIKEVALDIGCKVIDRPIEISGDNSKSDEALVHFAENSDFDILVFIQPTSPLIRSEDINKGLSMMDEYDSVFSACREHWIPRWTLDGNPDGWDINNRPMRQDVGERYVENGAFYITTRKQLETSGLRYGGKIGVVEMPLQRSFQIDTYDDLKLISKLNKRTNPTTFQLSDLQDASVFLIGPAQNAQVDPEEYEEYDYVARLNMYLSCFAEPPRTDIVFLNSRASRKYTRIRNKRLNNKIIFTKLRANRLARKYPTSLVIDKQKTTPGERAEFTENILYMGTDAMNTLLRNGANVTFGGADFYYDGFSNPENYPEGYWFEHMGPSGREGNMHRMSGDLNFIKNYLMEEFSEKLSFHEKTEYFFKKSLEKYNIQ